MGVGGATPSGSGSGITFPATQSASTDANTLDDYEEGTWTPTDTSGAGLGLPTANGSYTKIGNLVYVQGKIVYPSTANGATSQLGGLPFAIASRGGNNFPTGANAANGNTNALRSLGYATQTNFTFLTASDGVATNANLSAANINFSLTYITN
jgi:hypothetical protein